MSASGSSSSPSYSVAILVMKRLDLNTRIVRQARILGEYGHRVTVCCTGLPEEEVRAACPNTEWILASSGQKELAAPPFSWIRGAFEWARGIRRNLQDMQYVSRMWNGLIGRLFGLTLEQLSPLHWFALGLLACFIALPALLLMVTVSIPLVVGGWIAGLLLLTLTRLQTPRDMTPAVRFRDAWLLRLDKLGMALVQPYIELRRYLFGWHCLRHLKDHRFDIVQAHDTHALWAGCQLKKRQPHSRLVFDAVEVFAGLSAPKIRMKPAWVRRIFYRQEVRLMQRHVDRIISFGPGGAAWMAARYGIPKPDVILNCRYHNPIAATEELRADCGLSGQPDTRIITCLNTLYPGQGLEQLLAAMKHLPDHVHLATIGWDLEGNYVGPCLAIAEKGGYAHRIHCLPRRGTEALIPYAAGADISVIPRQIHGTLNNYFSMPNRVFDAIAAGLPIACGRLPCITRLLELFGIGETFDETDPKDMARVLAHMLEPENLAATRARTAKAFRTLCWQAEGQSYVRIIEATARGDLSYRREYFTASGQSVNPEEAEEGLRLRQALETRPEEESCILEAASCATAPPQRQTEAA